MVSATRWLCALALVLIHLPGYSQETVQGVVTSEAGDEGLPGVAIVVQGTSNGTISDIDGNYKLSIPDADEAILEFSFIGYKKEVVSVNGRTIINVKMSEDVQALDEVVVIGYGEQKKKEVTGAVARIETEELIKNATVDIGTALQGQIAGVSVQAVSGEPGAGSNIQIRGLSSVNGSSNPLYVVDGVPFSGDPKLSMNEIESIDVLKDAASASIYGTRGSGGVILITTKKGKAGSMKIGLDSYVGVQRITSGEHLMNREQSLYSNFIHQYHLNPNQHFQNTWSSLETNPHNFTHDTDIRGDIQNDNAIIQNHALTVSGGREGLTYNVVGSFHENEGTIINSGYERFNVRANTVFKKDKWTVNTGMGARVEKQQYAPWQFLLDAIKYNPLQQPLDPNASIIQDAGNGVQASALGGLMAKLKQDDRRHGNHFNGMIQISNQITKNLSVSSRFGSTFTDDTRVRINPLFIAYDDEGNRLTFDGSARSGVYNQSSRASSLAWENMVNYKKSLGEHNFKLLGVFSMEKYTFTSFFAEKKDLISNDVTTLQGATADPNVGTLADWNQDRANSLIGMLARLQYDFRGKYLFSASVRRDGSSRFAKENTWGVFPSVSAGWNVSDEAFWSPIAGTLTTFKIRASLGTTGNQNFLDYSNAATIAIGRDYPFGAEDNVMLGLGATQLDYANPEVKWETSQQLNVGFDMGLLSDRLTVTGDFYNTNKIDMLFPYVVPPTAGTTSSVILNIGDMTNKGVELAANWRQAGELSWSLGGTFSKNINEVTKMQEGSEIMYLDNSTVVQGVPNEDLVTAIALGYPAGSFFLIETDGIVDGEEELEAYKKIQPTAKMGDLKYVDQDGDSTITLDDRVYMGSGIPDFEVGLNFSMDYKGFDFSMNWYAAVGGEVMNGSKAYAYKYGRHMDQYYQWSPWNPNSDIPAHRGRDHYNARGYTDYWLEDGSFVRLRNVAFGYTLPKAVTQPAGISKLRVYLSAQNPITLTKYTGYDPEVGNNGLSSRGLDRGNYPISAIYRAGIQIDF